MNTMRRIAFAGLASVGFASAASAQAPIFGPGVGVGVGVGPGGTWAGPAVGPFGYGFGPGRSGPGFGPGFGYPFWGFPGFGFPGAVGGFWTNGLSLYGPPVPTGAPVPGTFGGGDSFWQLSNSRAGIYDPFIWNQNSPLHGASKDLPQLHLPPGYNGPRFATKDVRRRFDQLRTDPTPETWKATAETDWYNANRGFGWQRGTRHPVVVTDPATCLRVIVRVPTTDAQVWLDGVPTEAVGTERVFESPPLTAGQSYKYQVTAKWGTGTITTKTATGKPGETVAVGFGFGE